MTDRDTLRKLALAMRDTWIGQEEGTASANVGRRIVALADGVLSLLEERDKLSERILYLENRTPEMEQLDHHNEGAAVMALQLLGDDGRGEMSPGPCADALHKWRRMKAENDRLKAEESKLHPEGRYKCGCPAVRSDKTKLFCPTHLETLESTHG